MSGHSKWATIKRAKASVDAKRGNIFTKHAKLITVAARKGGDPKMNPPLRTAIDKAKGDNMPNANIERAILKGSGEDKEGGQIDSIMYEGYGPGGVALLVKTLTDNKNRTVADVRTVFSKHGGNLGEAGSVGWMFEERGILTAAGNGEAVELAAIDAGALDLEPAGDHMLIYTKPQELMKVKESLEAAGITVQQAELSMVAKDNVKITDETTAKKIMNLMDALEDNDDVVDISSNFDIDEGMMKKLS